MPDLVDEVWALWLQEARQTICALQERAPGSLRQAQLLCDRYRQLSRSYPVPALRPLPDFPLGCFFAGHEQPIAAVLADLVKQLPDRSAECQS